MKKLFFVLMLCPLLMLMASCTGSTGSKAKYKALDAEIEMADQQMPMQMTYAITLTNLNRDGNVVAYEYEINEEAQQLDDFIADENQFKANMKNEIVNNGEVVRFFSLVADAGCDLNYVYKGSHSGKVIVIVFSNAELKEMCKGSE